MVRKLALCGIAIQLLAAAAELRVPVSSDEEAELRATDLRAFIESSKAAPVVRVRTPKDDLLLMVVMDVVGDLAYVQPAKSALAAVFQALPENVHVTILRAQGGLRVVIDPTADRDALE